MDVILRNLWAGVTILWNELLATEDEIREAITGLKNVILLAFAMMYVIAITTKGPWSLLMLVPFLFFFTAFFRVVRSEPLALAVASTSARVRGLFALLPIYLGLGMALCLVLMATPTQGRYMAVAIVLLAPITLIFMGKVGGTNDNPVLGYFRGIVYIMMVVALVYMWVRGGANETKEALEKRAAKKATAASIATTVLARDRADAMPGWGVEAQGAPWTAVTNQSLVTTERLNLDYPGRATTLVHVEGPSPSGKFELWTLDADGKRNSEVFVFDSMTYNFTTDSWNGSVKTGGDAKNVTIRRKFTD